ncbi:uncharacterized protein LOC115735596 isoform X2 [Rhodamnia argentea]|uniref:Uncharacterized protein LOC115735596 isoform X2 n=1 Tax=Rhodamnia argentea TaxID=178133 RepID=A0A8B8NJW9_9MYRT|nr:uncharacterized protein LOC115735596 isoform X2 [Rhodamnia argentea]
MSYVKISSNYVCSKQGLAILLWLLKCIFRASLEQEIETLKKNLALCTRENINLQEELSEAYRIKSQLADLHSAEVTKNLEAEKQLKFFQGCVAAAFAERDHSIMEAEKAKEKEETMLQKLNDVEKRMQELTLDSLEQKKLINKLQSELAKQEENNDMFKKVVDMFYEIRQRSYLDFEDMTWDQKCIRLLNDPPEMWTYNDTSTSKYISALEEELRLVRNSVDDLQNKFRVGLEIENHLKKKVRELEKKRVGLEKMVRNVIVGLHQQYSLHRIHIKHILEEENSRMKATVNVIKERLSEFNQRKLEGQPVSFVKLEEYGCPDIHPKTDAAFPAVSEESATGFPDSGADRKIDASDALAQALQEKVSALLLLSQQEERHLLERNVNAALLKRSEELQRNLIQVTNEKVKALMELAQLRQDYQLLKEKMGSETRQGRVLASTGEKRLAANEQDGKLRNLLKRTYLKHWITPGHVGGAVEAHPSSDGSISGRKSSYSMDIARMRIENATLKESMDSMEHITSSIHRLRLALLQAKASVGISEALEDVISEAKLVKTALGSCLPVSWSAGMDEESSLDSVSSDSGDLFGDPGGEKVDSVSAAGYEMVELLILAAQTLKDTAAKTEPGVPAA